MIEGFPPSALVVVNLIGPKEKFFGVLASLSAAGVTMQAINLDSFEDWMRQIARDETPDIGLATMFFPLFRVERIFLDQPSGSIKSLAQRFDEVVGRSLADHLGIAAEE